MGGAGYGFKLTRRHRQRSAPVVLAQPATATIANAGGAMNAMLLLIPISLLLVALSIWAFFWAVDQDQFESLDRASLEALDRDVPDPLEPPHD